MTPVEIRTLFSPEGQALLAELADYAPGEELALASRLRRTHPPELVSAALTQARLRQRAGAKFGPDAPRMYFTANGVEQSTRASVAAHRAARFAELGATRVADLCCGIGGDAIALARAGLGVLAVDRDPEACAAAEANAAALGLADRIEVVCADVTAVDTAGCDALFTDPARRTARGRTFDPEAYSPPLSWALAAASAGRFRCAAVKVAPGIPHEAVPDGVEAEWVSESGDVKEAALWFGTAPAAASPHRATLLPSSASLAGGRLPDPPSAPVGRFLYEPDGAVIRAHLVAEVAAELGGATLIDPTIAYLSSERLTATPYASAYRITDVLPFNLKRLRALLREREVGNLTVKKRGSAVEPEELRRKVKPAGPNAATVFLTRADGAPTMLVGHPAAAG
ncbi:class I SAM-dependent methyltransferase [Phaeacidiphilus oryzae]|uniref:class I SAM-dependent methyltransferase n=1 Tax=Phaeacidiphilus oryzae TaxID=348818 RepID=UPI000564B8B4|nr:class I SAM-dependent methyltransferase [Phaeacidiphilus oryzae]